MSSRFKILYYLYFKYNSNCTNTLLYDAMLTFEITLTRSFGKRRTSWAFPPQDRHWCPIGGSQDWRVQWNGTRAPGVRALVICYMKLSSTPPKQFHAASCCHSLFSREKKRERELIYVAISATWVHLNFSSRSGKYSYLTKWKGLSPKGLLYRSGFTWLNKLYINL